VVGQDGNIYVGGGAEVLTPNTSAIYPYVFLQIPTNGISADGQGSVPYCWRFWDNDNTNNSQHITNLSLLSSGALAFAGVGRDSTGSVGGVGVGRYQQPPSSCTLDTQYGTNGLWYSTDWQSIGDALFETDDGSVDLLVGNGTTNPSANSLVRVDPTGKQTADVDLPFYGYGITRASDSRYLVTGQLPLAGNDSMVVAYYKYNTASGFTPDTFIGNQGVVNIPVSTALTNPTGIGLRAVYMPDGSRTVVVGSMLGTNAAGNTVEHLVVARIWN